MAHFLTFSIFPGAHPGRTTPVKTPVRRFFVFLIYFGRGKPPPARLCARHRGDHAGPPHVCAHTPLPPRSLTSRPCSNRNHKPPEDSHCIPSQSKADCLSAKSSILQQNHKELNCNDASLFDDTPMIICHIFTLKVS